MPPDPNRTKASPGNFFEDFVVDQVIEHAVPRTVTEGDNALYIALTGDRYPLYCDAEFARRLGYKRELINDLLVFHIVFGKTVPDISYNAVANLGYAKVRFKAPVYPGDTLRARTKIVGLKENSSGKTGTVYVRTRGFNQKGNVVLEFYRWVMVHKRMPDTPTGLKDAPQMPAEVPPEKLIVDEQLELDKFNPAVTGGSWYIEDYMPGERIFHPGAMTIEDAEHQLATRLYQNTARVHFDAQHMAGTRMKKRLVYGGHVISVARALAFNGLENALRILAWNSGTHANPVFAGDTLYAFTDILSYHALPGRDDCGALRLALVAVKNMDPQQDGFQIKVHDAKAGKWNFHPNVVLNLDHYVLVPNRPRERD